MISLVLALTVLAGQATDDAAVTRELKQMEQQLASPPKNGDCDRWGAIIAPEWSVTTRFVPEPRCLAPRLQGVPAARGFSLAARNVYASADMCAACSLFAAPPWPPSMFS